jgi:hypothetical protein
LIGADIEQKAHRREQYDRDDAQPEYDPARAPGAPKLLPCCRAAHGNPRPKKLIVVL